MTMNKTNLLENWTLAPEAPRSETLPTSIVKSNSAIVTGQQQLRRVLIAYKVIRVINGRYYSLIDGKREGKRVEYVINREMREEARPNHGGGFYVHVANNVMHIFDKFKSGDLISPINTGVDYGIIECEVAPPFVYYDADGNSISPNSDMARLKKISVSWLLPVRFHGSFTYGGRNREQASAVPSWRTPVVCQSTMSYAEQLNAKWGHLQEY